MDNKPHIGRAKGAPNKLTLEIKDMIMMALHKSGGVAYLQQLAIDEPASFAALLGKLIPRHITAEIAHGLSESVMAVEQRKRDMRIPVTIDQDGKAITMEAIDAERDT